MSDVTKSAILHKQRSYMKVIFSKVQPHLELSAAIISGLLIFIGWLTAKLDDHTLSVTIYIVAFIIGGFAKAKEGIQSTIKNKKLNVEMLMIFAAIGSASIGYWAEGAILIFIFSLSGALETYTLNKSRKEISSLMEIQPEYALRLSDGKEELISITELRVGDQVLVKPGDRIPADGTIIRGETTVDEATITGESIPVTKKRNDDIFTGTVNLTGSFTAEVKKRSDETLFHKIIELVQTAQSEKSPSQLFIERFESLYVRIVLLTVLAMMFLPHYLFGWSWTETLYRAMILLVVASPCALVASVMPATLSAISNGARHGILFKGGAHLESLSHLKMIAFDKTGTLTKGKPEVTNFIARDNDRTHLILQNIASVENESTHPLAQAIVRYAQSLQIDLISPHSEVEDIVGRGVKATVNGVEWAIGKPEFVGKEEAERFADGIFTTWAHEGKTVIFARDDNGIAAVIGLKDIIRPDAKETILSLKKMKIQSIMLTGDAENTAKAIAKESKLDHYIAECLPEIKVEHIKELKKQYGAVAMVGDGINDAPALATADIGIAMGGGTDIALETSDVVLMKDELTRIADSIKLSKRMNRIIKQNIFISISVILVLIASNFLAMIDLPLGVIGHEGSTILVILNGLRLLR